MKAWGKVYDSICVKDIEIFVLFWVFAQKIVYTLLFNHICPTPHFVFIFLRCIEIPDGTLVCNVTMMKQA